MYSSQTMSMVRKSWLLSIVEKDNGGVKKTVISIFLNRISSILRLRAQLFGQAAVRLWKPFFLSFLMKYVLCLP